MGPTKASKPEGGWGGGGVQPHGSKAIAQAAPSTCLGETNTIRVHRRVVDETTKHVGSTAMGPTKASKPEGGWGGGGVQPHGSKAIAQAAPSTCPCVALGETNTIRVHRRVVDETTKHVGSTAMGPTKASKPKGGWGGGGVQPHGSKAIAQAAPSTCPCVALGETNTIRVHRRVVDETTKHVGSTAMGPTKANRSKETEHKRTHTWHSRDFFPEISVAGKSRRPPRTTTARLAVGRRCPPPPAGGVRTHLRHSHAGLAEEHGYEGGSECCP
jgi:rRNA processing protein Gar1